MLTAKERASLMFDEWAAMPVRDMPEFFEKHLREQVALLRAEFRTRLEKIVCTVGEDRGVVMLDVQGTTHYDRDLKCQAYDCVNFSPLGDALIELYELVEEKEQTS